MPLVLRVDVDKPYGRSNFKEKILSKICEDYWLPTIYSLGYLNHVKKFLIFLSEERIRAHIYFRICTLPPKDWLNNTLLSRHLIGHHAENTLSFERLRKEIEIVQSHMSPLKVSSFTKHGSGNLKLGRYHYPAYEPDKYKKWALKLGIPFLFGNEELVRKSTVFTGQNGYYPLMFWIDRTYSSSEQLKLEEVVSMAQHKNIIVIIHPCNFVADKQVEANMKKLILLSRHHNVPWITLENE